MQNTKGNERVLMGECIYSTGCRMHTLSPSLRAMKWVGLSYGKA